MGGRGGRGWHEGRSWCQQVRGWCKSWGDGKRAPGVRELTAVDGWPYAWTAGGDPQGRVQARYSHLRPSHPRRHPPGFPPHRNPPPPPPPTPTHTPHTPHLLSLLLCLPSLLRPALRLVRPPRRLGLLLLLPAPVLSRLLLLLCSELGAGHSRARSSCVREHAHHSGTCMAAPLVCFCCSAGRQAGRSLGHAARGRVTGEHDKAFRSTHGRRAGLLPRTPCPLTCPVEQNPAQHPPGVSL